MDFLSAVKQKLQELEEQARLMELGVEFPGTQAAKGGAGSERGKGRGDRSRREPNRAGIASQEKFETPTCPTANAPQTPLSLPQREARPRLVDDLHGRLDEAFLLSEILGPPRCLRGWDD